MGLILYVVVFLLGNEIIGQEAVNTTDVPTANFTVQYNATSLAANVTFVPSNVTSVTSNVTSIPSNVTSVIASTTVHTTTDSPENTTNTNSTSYDNATQELYDVTMPLTTPIPHTTTVSPFNCSVPEYDCFNNGTCVNSSRCDCLEGYTGEKCEHFMHCNATSCMNGGSCDLAANQSYTCNCTTGDREKSCALNTDKECTTIPILNYHAFITCIDRIDGFELLCSPNYTGPGCSQKANDDYCNRHSPYYCTNIDYCMPRCNTDACGGTDACTFTIKPFEGEAFINSSQCINLFANGLPSSECETEDFLFDGLDRERRNLTDCSPYFTTVCTESFNDGVCNPVCNNSDCLYDGGDCINQTQTYIPGGVVLELKTLDWHKAHTVTQLLLRSGVKAKPNPFPRPHVLMNVKYGRFFKKISTVGKFLAAAFAKLPDLIQLTDIFYCERGNYSESYFDKCNRSCSANCLDIGQENAICDWKNGQCSHGCKSGYWGTTCTDPCPSNCRNDMCNRRNQHCSIGCKPGFYGSTCMYACPLHCLDNRCDNNGRCNCIIGYFWSENSTNCVPCSSKCDNDCDPKTGLCVCEPPFYGPGCGLTCSADCKDQKCNNDGLCSGCKVGRHGSSCGLACPERCPECDKHTGNCRGVCMDGYEGNSCQKLVIPVTDNTGVIIAIILALTIVFLIIIITYCCWKRRQSGDYVLEDEEREPYSKPKKVDTKVDTLQVQPTLAMQPIVTGLGKSTDMIDMDDRVDDPGIYTGPKRNTILSSTEITTSSQKTGINGDVMLQSPAIEHDDTGTARTSWSVDAKYIDVSSTDDELDGYGEDGSVTNEGKVMSDFDREANLPPDTPDDSDHEMNVPLVRSSMAPLASEEDILMSKENLLEDAGLEELEGQDDDHDDDEELSSRKSSVSSKSSKSSGSSDSSDSSKSRSKDGIKKDSDSAISEQ